jgi:hypothetical protein
VPPPAVTVSAPLARDLGQRAKFLGQFSAVDRVELRAQVGGILKEIRFKDGQIVHKGDLLFVIRISFRLTHTDHGAYRGTLDFIDNSINRRSGAIHVRATVENADLSPVPGEFADLNLTTSAPQVVLLIPDASGSLDQSEHVVTTVALDGTVVAKAVVLGGLSDGLRIVRNGLGPDDRVIIDRHAAQQEPGRCREKAHRHDQDHRKRPVPTLVLSGQDEKGEQCRGSEDEQGRRASLSLLIGEVCPLEAEPAWQHLFRQLLRYSVSDRVRRAHRACGHECDLDRRVRSPS